MKCEEALVLINQTIDNCISDEDRRALQEHLDSCARCRALLQSYSELQAGLLSLEAEPPARFAQGVMERIVRESGKKRRFAFGRASALCAVAAVLLLALSTSPVQQLLGIQRGVDESVQNSAEDAGQTGAGMDASAQEDSAGNVRAETSFVAQPQISAASEESGSAEEPQESDGVTADVAPEESSVESAENGLLAGTTGIAPEEYLQQQVPMDTGYACELKITGDASLISDYSALQGFSFTDTGDDLRAETTVQKAQLLYAALSDTLVMTLTVEEQAQPDALAVIVIVP